MTTMSRANNVIPAQVGTRQIKHALALRGQKQKALLINSLDSRLRGNDAVKFEAVIAKGQL